MCVQTLLNQIVNERILTLLSGLIFLVLQLQENTLYVHTFMQEIVVRVHVYYTHYIDSLD